MYNLSNYKYLKLLSQVCLAVVIGISATGCSYQRSLVSGNKTAYGYSWERELEIGREADPAIVAQFGVYEDEEVAEYVRVVGQRVLSESHFRRPDTPPQYRIDFTFRVLNSPVLNAFALPGGYVYVTRGLLAHMENEAQLAVVLGHEISHVAARHASRQAFRTQISQIGLIGGAIAGEVLADAGAELLQIGGAASQLLLLSYSRGQESESDELGVEYAAKAGYDAAEGAGFFDTLDRVSQRAGDPIPTWQSTHPDPGQREVTIKELAANWNQQLEMDEVGRDRLLNTIDRIVVGANPREGFVKNNVFYHPDLAFRFPVPRGWTLHNLSARVVMIDPQQQAVVILTLAQGDDLVDVASSFAEKNQLTVQDHGRLAINGLDAYYLEATFARNQQPFRLASYFILYNDLIYQFLGYTDARRFSAMESSLKHPPEGFRSVADPAILNVQPDRLRLVTASRRGQLSSFIGNLPEQFDPEDIAIMNQLQLNSVVSQGHRLKLVSSPGG